MNSQSTVEYNSLSWVKKQLDTVLADAQASLSEYTEKREEEPLRQCAEHLKLVYGTLQMVEVYGAAMLAEEMLQTVAELEKGTVERVEDAYDVLMRAMLQLPDYLENIQSGGTDTPIVLMSLINDLRSTRNDNLLSESVLFVANTDDVELKSEDYNSDSIEAGKLAGEVKRLRKHFQLGLLDIIRNHKEITGLQRIKAVLHALEKVSHNDEVRHLWMVANALVEGLLHEGIDNNVSVKMLFSALDRQLKNILDKGEEEFSVTYSRDLLKNMLYYVGTCTTDSNRIKAIKQAYKLEEFIPADKDKTFSAIGGLNVDLFETVSRGITEDLFQVKDALEIFMHNDERDTQQLKPVSERLSKIADTFGMLSMGATRQKIIEQHNVIEKIICGDEVASEPLILNVAAQLLNAESDLKEFITNRSGYIARQDDENQIVPSSEYRQVVLTVVAEALKNFSVAKEALLSYISAIGGMEQLDLIINKLEEVRGVALMLPLGRVENQIGRLKNYVCIALRDNKRQTESGEQDTVADVVTSIEYYLEALAEGRPGIDLALDSGDKASEVLVEIYRCYDDEAGSQNVKCPGDTDVRDEKTDEIVTNQNMPEVSELLVDDSKNNAISKTEADKPSLPVENRSEGKIHIIDAPDYDQQYTILADDADEEIVEIFIEEAVEVLGDLHSNFPQWKATPDDEEAVSNIRRSFHTLKGSGRLIGAELIGEFAWKFENVLNRVIDKKILRTPALFNAVDEALSVLPQLIEQLKGNREPIQNINALMATADAVADGIEPVVINAVSDEKTLSAEITGHNLSAPEVEDSVLADSDMEENLISIDELDNLELIEIDEEVKEASNMAGDDNIDSNDDTNIADNVININDLKDKNTELTDEIIESDVKIVDDNAEQTSQIENADIFDMGIDNDIDVIDLDGYEVENEIEISDLLTEKSPESSTDDGSRPGTINPTNSVTEVIGSDEIDVSKSVERDDLSGITEAISFNESEIINNENTADDDLYVIEIDEDDTADLSESNALNDDPLLLRIYYDESLTHLNNIHELVRLHQSGKKHLTADKNISRIFHTLYGSARTAEVPAIAEISGVAEKYIKEKKNRNDDKFSDEIVNLFDTVEQSLRHMLSSVEIGEMPENDKVLLDRLNKVLQNEIQTQLQSSISTNRRSSDNLTIDDSSRDVLNNTSDEMPDRSIESADVEGNISSSSMNTNATMVIYGDIDNDLIDIFIEEADELLENCEQILQFIKQKPDTPEYIQQLQRNMHTLKGGARMAEIAPVGDLTHILESLVVLISENKIETTTNLLELIQESIDTLTGMMESVKQRKQIKSAGLLISRIELLMSGDIEEKRSLERYDISLSDLDKPVDSDDLSLLVEADQAPGSDSDLIKNNQMQAGDQVTTPGDSEAAKPHWGERATDVNFVESQEQVRVRSGLLNNLVNYAGEVNIYHARLGKQVADFSFNLSELSQTVERLKDQLRKMEIETEIQIRSGYGKEADRFDAGFDPLEMDRYSTLQQLTRGLMETAGDVDSIENILSDITRDSETLLVQESRVSTDLQEGLMRTRMVRFGGLSSRMRRIVRQISKELKKEVELKIIGENSEIDRTVLDRIIAPLEHMIRNAVAHGIESPKERLANNKAETGNITVTVGRKGTTVVINVKDDGRGVDIGKVRNIAIKQGLLDAEEPTSEHDILQLILHSGFSTADEVTQISGRGVGMDVVDSEIKQLGGVLEISTVAGRGTEFNIHLPLTLAINQALLVTTGEDIYAVPLTSIQGVVRVTGIELQRFYDADENTSYEFNGVKYNLKHLGVMLTGIQADYSKQLRLFPVLLVTVGEQHFALHVDDLIGRREIVVKPVGMQIGGMPGIAGATILADGRVVLILELSALLTAGGLFKPEHTVQPGGKKDKHEKRLSIMVVDDSITIRKVTERILGRNGFDVILAKDGVDATNKMQDHIPDLMLLDIEMPRMDGFEVATYVRNDERLKALPIIMITSRTGGKHKEKAMAIGVNQYLGKPFQEEELMDNINSLLNKAS